MILKIISADQMLFEGEITSVTLPGVLGSFTVLKNHASLISVLTVGVISYKAAGESDNEHNYDITGGIADVDNNVVSVCLY